MNCRQLRHLRGPNLWAACPVIEAVLDLGDAGPWSVEQIRQTRAHLGEALFDPQGEPAADGAGSPGGLAQVFALAALKLQNLAGNPVSFSVVRPTSRPGLFLVAVEYAEEPVGQAAAETAWRLLQALAEGRPLLLQEDQRRLRELANDRRLPVSTRVIYDAARARGIPAARLSPDYGRYLRLGQGAKQHRCRASEPDSVSAVARMVSTDKHLAKELLRAAGVPVPEGRLVATAEEAWTAACELGLPVAIKPQDSDLATGVSLDLRTRAQVEAGFDAAHEHSPAVLVERFAPGMEHRVLVVADRVVAVTRIEPPHVVGDGVSTVAELVDEVNRDPRRGDEGSAAPLGKLQIDAVAQEVLAAQGSTLASIPRAGEWILVRRNPPYIKHGGNLVDLTDRIHPSTAAHAVAAAEALQLHVAGLDMVVVDIGQPLEDQGGVVVEINVSPGLWLHLAPWSDFPRPVGADIVASIYPPGHDGRIPVAALVGDATGSAATHLTALLTYAGLRVGRAGAEEIVVGDRHWVAQAATPQDRAGLVLQNPTVDAALLETSARELVRAGFGNDRCDVALLLGSHSAEKAADTAAEGDEIGPAVGEFVHALRHALAPEGVLVLPAEAESVQIATRLPAPRLFLVARPGDFSHVHAHLAAGGRALGVQGDGLVLAQGAQAPFLLGKCPEGMTERETPGLMAALAAGLVLGLTAETLQTYLGSFP